MSKEESSSVNIKLSSLPPAYVNIKWLPMHGGVASTMARTTWEAILVYATKLQLKAQAAFRGLESLLKC